MNRMKTVSLYRTKCDVLHVEHPLGIVNITKGLHDDAGREVLSVEIIPSEITGEESVRSGFANTRLVKVLPSETREDLQASLDADARPGDSMPEPATPEKPKREVIMRTEFAKQPATLPTAVVLYRFGGQYVVHNQYKQPDGQWSYDNGYYCDGDNLGYAEALGVYDARVQRYKQWFSNPENLARIETFVEVPS